MPRPKILIVEDETIVAMDIARGLRGLGYGVVGPTSTGADAIRLAREYRPDLVLMDIRLQGSMDGIEAGCQIRQELHLPIVFLTAYADETTVQRAKSAEPFGYLLKPFEDQELHTAIEIAMHKREAEKLALAQSQEQLRQSEERFRLLVDTLKDYAVFLLDVQGRIVSWNRGAEKIKGWSQNEIVGKHFSVFYQAEDVVRNRPDKILWTAAQEGRVCDEGWRVRKDGSRFWADVVVTALHDPEGKLLGFAKVTRDVTEKKRADEEIRELNATLEQRVRQRTEELRAANRELEAFTSSVAHDLRAPLRGLQGYLCILQEEAGPQLSPGAAEHLSRGALCSQRMTRMVDDLLNLSRVGQQKLEYQPVRLDELAREVAAELSRGAGGRPVEWHIELLAEVQCDPSLMRQAMFNLLSNALKYSAGRQPALIQVGQKEQGGRRVFFVRDNGAGFSMEDAGKLFQPFSRLHSKQEFEGTGVGLTNVERIIRRHGGRIWAEAEAGKGATFYFTLGPSGGEVALSQHRQEDVRQGGGS